jgi:hypothetical protein
VSIQRTDGGWGKLDTPDPANPDESSWHSTTLALLLLLHVEFPTALKRGGVEQKAPSQGTAGSASEVAE